MATYSKTEWIDGETHIDAINLNKIEGALNQMSVDAANTLGLIADNKAELRDLTSLLSSVEVQAEELRQRLAELEANFDILKNM